MVTDDEVERAVEYLHKSSVGAAQARANRLHIEAYFKSKRSELMVKSSAKSAIDREAEALSHPDYLELLAGYKVAVEQDETHRNKRDAAQAFVATYQTQSANQRSVKL